MNSQFEIQKTTDLTTVADELYFIANRLRSTEAANEVVLCNSRTSLSRAKEHYQIRRQRDKAFGDLPLFGEPVWDMLIDLFIAAEEQRTVSVTSLCMASCVPPTTALRWISILEEQGMILRKPDSSDARRFFLSLESSFHDRIKRFFAKDI